MTYEEILNRQPPSTSNGNRAVASEFVVFLNTVIEGSGLGGLSEGQKNYLYRLRDKWTKRAAGSDLRWNSSGSRPGRPPKGLRAIRKVRRDPSEDSPLFRSLMSKYGQPKGGE